MRGQAVILGLIQVGGLGIVTIAMFITFLQRRRLELREMMLVRDMLNVQALGSLGRFLGYLLAITLVAELTGAAVLYHATGKAWWSVFHSVSAFCNAGFGLDRDNLVTYARMPQIVLTVAGLVVVGGIGFPVLLDLLSFELQSLPFVRRMRGSLRGGAEERPPSRLSLHTKLALAATALLIVGGAALFHVSEAKGSLAAMTPPEQMMTSLFQSVTTRTAGFNTVDVTALKDPTLLLFLVLMLIGASPVSTGGGMKTTTAAVLLLTVMAMIRNREPVEAFGRTVPRRIVNAAVAIVSMYVVATLLVTTVLLATQPEGRFLTLLFESVSALCTVGLSAGVTSTLDDTGRLVICAAMLVGRVGPLAILWSFLSRPPGLQYEYPEEPVIVS
jgi:trk system potassium uptake protein TrkH